MSLMSVRGYARHRKITHPAVIKAINTGRIMKRADGKIDSERADRDWERNTDPSRPQNSVTGRPHHRRRPNAPPLPMGMPEPPPEHANGSNGNGRAAGTYAAASAVRMSYQAKMARLEYDKAEGRLVEADKVREVAFRAARETRRQLQGLPARLASELAAITDPITLEHVLATEIERACNELIRAFTAGNGVGPKDAKE